MARRSVSFAPDTVFGPRGKAPTRTRAKIVVPQSQTEFESKQRQAVKFSKFLLSFLDVTYFAGFEECDLREIQCPFCRDIVQGDYFDGKQVRFHPECVYDLDPEVLRTFSLFFHSSALSEFLQIDNLLDAVASHSQSE